MLKGFPCRSVAILGSICAPVVWATSSLGAGPADNPAAATGSGPQSAFIQPVGLEAEFSWANPSRNLGEWTLTVAPGPYGTDMVLASSFVPLWSTNALYVFDENLEGAQCILMFSEYLLDSRLWQSPGSPEPSIHVADRTGISRVGLDTCQLQESVAFPDLVEPAVLADLDADGHLDVAFSEDGQLYAGPWNDPDGWVLVDGIAARDPSHNSTIKVKQLDGHPGMDLLFHSWTEIYLISGHSLELIHAFERDEGIGNQFGAARFRHDGIPDLLIDDWQEDELAGFEIPSDVQSFSYPTSLLNMVKSYDLTGDGLDEVLLVEGNQNLVKAVDSDGAQILTFGDESTAAQVYNIAARANAGDPVSEIFISGNLGSPARPRIRRFDAANGNLIAQTDPLGEISPIAGSGTMLGDGRVQAIFRVGIGLPSRAGYALLDVDSGEVQIEFNDEDPTSDIWNIATSRNSDEMPVLACMTRGSGTSFTRLECWNDFTESEPVWEQQLQDAVSLMEIEDVDTDGTGDVIVLHNADGVKIFSGSSGALLWENDDEVTNFLARPSIALAGNAVWILGISGPQDWLLVKLDQDSGEILDTWQSSSIRAIASVENQLIASVDGLGAGFVDPVSLEVTEWIYETGQRLEHIAVSGDEEVLFLGLGGDGYWSTSGVIVERYPTMQWRETGPLLAQSVEIPDRDRILVMTQAGITAYRVRAFEEVFHDGFE